MTRIFTIGFTKKSAEQFFGLIGESGATRLVDVRLNNISQLAGFAKRDDLAFFLRRICDVSYRHEPLLAPTKPMLDEYKKSKGSWSDYEARFLALMRERAVERVVEPTDLHNAVLLCSEPTPHQCHRRLVVDYLGPLWGGVDVEHLT